MPDRITRRKMLERCAAMWGGLALADRAAYSGGGAAADAAGVELCVECGLCSFVCTSKLDLRSEFRRAKITIAEEHLDHAERLGMEVREPRFRLRDANDALKNARTVIHSFSTDAVDETLAAGTAICDEVEQAAQDAIDEYTNRRIWLALSLVPLFAVVGLLVLYIRTLPPPSQVTH